MGFPTSADLQLEPASLLKNALKALGDLFVDAIFNFSDKGCEIQAKDTNGIAHVRLFLPQEVFEEYSCRDGGLAIGLDLTEMAQVFRHVNNDDIITIKEDHELDDIAIFTFKSPGDVDAWSFHFRLDEDDDSLPYIKQDPLESEYHAIVRMPSAKFMSICEKLSSSGDERTAVIVSVEEGKEGVSFFAGGENGNSNFFCSKTPTADKPKESVVVDVKKEVSLIFDLWYMKSFSKVSTLADEVTICLSSEKKKPSLFEYKISGECCYIRYYLEPRPQVQKPKMQNEGEAVDAEKKKKHKPEEPQDDQTPKKKKNRAASENEGDEM